ncbi:MAG TPA: hemolysin family protein [Candidatus Cloacimonadota bacterium]|nr:hemolysin family protein [Candidatus Cloacimonadota bacterium]HQL14713.1 hemolysin family protein [Candidatus Cloacimonadota bacterium]
MGIIPVLFLILFFLCLSFLFSGLETGLMSVNRLKLEEAARSNKRYEHLLKFIQQPDKFLGTTLIGNNIVNVIIASVSTYLVQSLTNNYGITNFDPRWMSLISGGVVLIFGEIIPKAIFRDYADTLVPQMYPVLIFFYTLLKPFVAAVTWLNRSIQKLLKIDTSSGMFYLTRDDLAFLLSQTTVNPEEEPHLEMIEDALEFNAQKAHNVMVPRTDVVAIEASTPLSEVQKIAAKEGFTRYPVYQETLDNIVGILIIYDIIRKGSSDTLTAGQLVHEPYFIPENTDLDIVLKEMQKRHLSMAVIVDSFGGTAGIITMEDILEEIVGDIIDEYDTEEDTENEVEQIGPNTWIVAGDVEIDTLNDEYEMELPKGDYVTVAGLILDKLERIPHQGQIISCGKYSLQVLQTTSRKIVKVKIHCEDTGKADTINEQKEDKL